MATLLEEMDSLLSEDPARTVRLVSAYTLAQSIGVILASGVSADELRECVESAIEVSQRTLAALSDTIQERN